MEMIEPILTYLRTLRFTGPEQIKRYYRLFGDLEYDLLALRVEKTVMELRLREVKRRIATCTWITEEEEREISVSSHELAEYMYARLDTLQAKISMARAFQFDQAQERQCYYLLCDIGVAILGVEDESVRTREQQTFEVACDAYGHLDIPALIDLHDGVQNLLGLQRRDALDEGEVVEWRRKLDELRDSHPLRFADDLNEPDRIAQRMQSLRRRICREQKELEQSGMIYTAAIRAIRFRN